VENVFSSKHQKINKCVVYFGEVKNVILGEDLSIAEVVIMANKTFVGKSYGRHFNEKTLKEWMV